MMVPPIEDQISRNQSFFKNIRIFEQIVADVLRSRVVL